MNLNCHDTDQTVKGNIWTQLQKIPQHSCPSNPGPGARLWERQSGGLLSHIEERRKKPEDQIQLLERVMRAGGTIILPLAIRHPCAVFMIINTETYNCTLYFTQNYVLCCMYVFCILYYVLCIMYYVFCILYYVLCIMYHLLCILYFILCIMYYVLYSMYYVVCIMYYVVCIMYYVVHMYEVHSIKNANLSIKYK